MSDTQADGPSEPAAEPKQGFRLPANAEQLGYWTAAGLLFVAICAVLIFEALPPFPVEQPAEPAAEILEAERLYNEREFRDARIILDEFIEENPDDARAHMIRARVRTVLGLYAAAVDDLDMAHGLDPDKSEYLIARGELRLTIGWMEDAERDFTLAIDREPNNVNALIKRASVLASMGREADAIADLNIVDAIEPGNEDAILMRGDVNYRYGKLQQALDAYSLLAGGDSPQADTARRNIAGIQQALTQSSGQGQ